jgi:hypothetical protein
MTTETRLQCADLRADLAAVTAERNRLAADLAHVQALTEQGAALVATLAEGVTRCARCGETPVVGTREEMPVCPGCERVVALEVERDRLARDNAALREAAGALVTALTTSGGGYSCGTCYALATVGEPLPHGGYAFRCDKHASPPEKGWQDDPQEPRPTKAAAPLRTLRALLAQGEG